MCGVTGAVIGGAVIGAAGSVYAGRQSAKAAQKGADTAAGESARQFDLVRSDTAKLRGLGDAAVGRINRLFGYAPAKAEPLSYDEWLSQNGTLQGFSPGGGSVWDRMAGGVQSSQAAYQQYLAEQKQPVEDGKPDLSAFFESPDYQFRLGETQKALDRMSSARGRFASGAALKEGERYASNLASGEFASFYDRLAQQAGLGVTGIGQSAAAGATAANIAGNAALSAGNARANAYMQGGAGVNNAIQGGIQNWALQRYLNQPTGAPA